MNTNQVLTITLKQQNFHQNLFEITPVRISKQKIRKFQAFLQVKQGAFLYFLIKKSYCKRMLFSYTSCRLALTVYSYASRIWKCSLQSKANFLVQRLGKTLQKQSARGKNNSDPYFVSNSDKFALDLIKIAEIFIEDVSFEISGVSDYLGE